MLSCTPTSMATTTKPSSIPSETLERNADHHSRILHLQQLQQHTATIMAKLYAEHERKYKEYIVALLLRKRQIGQELLNKAMEQTMNITNTMIAVIHDFYAQRLKDSDLKIRNQSEEIEQLQLVTGGIWDLLSKMKGGSDPLLKELIDGFLSSETAVDRPTVENKSASSPSVTNMHLDDLMRIPAPIQQQPIPSPNVDTNTMTDPHPPEGSLCPNVNALLRQLNASSSSAEKRRRQKCDSTIKSAFAPIAIEDGSTQPMTLGKIPSFGTVPAPKLGDLTSAIDTVTMSSNHVQPPLLQTTSNTHISSLPQPMIPSIAGARSMSSFSITPSNKPSVSTSPEKVPILGLGNLFSSDPMTNGSLRPSKYKKAANPRPMSNGLINLPPTGDSQQQRSRKRKLDDSSVPSQHAVTDRFPKRIKLETQRHTQSIDELLQKVMTLKPNLRWNRLNEWCRYCGARGSTAFFDSPFGSKTLCHPHYAMWKDGKLQLTATNIPLDPEHAIDTSQCTERRYLMDFLHSSRTTLDRVMPSEVDTSDSEDSYNSDDIEDDDYDEDEETDGISEESDGALDQHDVDPIDCFVIAANCKLCNASFDDFGKYKRHIQQHYNDDDSKEWKVCSEPGCDPRKRWKYSHFVTHLIGLHGWDRPFWCAMQKHGVRCSYSASHKSNMIQHLRSVHGLKLFAEDTIPTTKSKEKKKRKKRKRKKPINSRKTTAVQRKPKSSFVVDDDDYECSEEEPPLRIWKNGRPQSVLDQYRGIYYNESCNCKLCGEHFEDFSLYKQHLKRHFDGDPNRKWKQCNEPGCDPTKTYSCPIPHLCGSHGFEYPYHCLLKSEWNEKCYFRASGKQNMMRHLNKVHGKKFPPNPVPQPRSISRSPEIPPKSSKKAKSVLPSTPKPSRKSLPKSSPKSLPNSKPQPAGTEPPRTEKDPNYNAFYLESANCKLCGAHFDDFKQYQAHLRGHFDADPNLKWKRCFEPGCDPNKYYNNFIPHLCALHGFDHPFQCNQSFHDGQRCPYKCSVRQNMLHHLKSIHKDSVMQNNPRTLSDINNLRIRSAELDQYRDRYYRESADCILCGEHFDDFDHYKAHLKQHFVKDPNRTWGRCNEIGCDSTKRIACFMSHLCVNHGYQRPFHCTMKNEDGTRCRFTGPIRYRMMRHLRGSHKVGEPLENTTNNQRQTPQQIMLNGTE